MVTTILFPSSYYGIDKVDEDMKQEYGAVLVDGHFRVILFGYDAWFSEGKLRLSEKPDENITAIYRGWMMQPDQYKSFYEKLQERHIHLITTPAMYELMHMFPVVYPQIKDDTAKILTFPLHSRIDIDLVKSQFNRFMVKDYVKSVKGTEFPSYFDQSITQEEFDRWMEVFYHYRANLLTGGICIKEFLPLKRYGDKTNEYRVYYLNHEIISVSRNSLQGNYTPIVPQQMVEKWRNLNSVFYTVDFAELEDGSWKIIEVGDGSVSGLSDGQDYISFFRKLFICCNEEQTGV